MKKSFSARRVPRKIGGDDEDDTPKVMDAVTPTGSDSEPSSAVKRPFNKSRKSSSLRTSIGPVAAAQEEDEQSTLITPKRSNLSRLAIQKNAEKRAGADIPFRAGRDEDAQPRYSTDYLQELKQSTPSTPRDLSVTPKEAEPEQSRALDVSSKFGKDISRYSTPSAIPSDAEIKEKKERRARLAKEQDFMSLDASEGEDDSDDNVTHDDQGRLILKPQEKYPETRLVREDEDILEDFDDFTTDGRMALGRKAEREAEVKRKADMAAMINDAEAMDEDDSEADESEVERNAAFEIAQTKHGNYATRAEQKDEIDRPKTPPRIAPLPTLDGVMDRLRKRLEEMQVARMAKLKEMDGLKAEKKQLGHEEVRVQTALKETGEKYAKLRQDMGVKNEETQLQVAGTNGHANDIADEDEDDYGDEDDVNGRGGLGRAGLGAGAGAGLGAGLGAGSFGGGGLGFGGTLSMATPVGGGSDSSD